MFAAGNGLTAIGTSDLKKALKYLHSGDLHCPLDVKELARCGLQHVALELLDHLRGLDSTAVRAVLVAVLAERKPAGGSSNA